MTIAGKLRDNKAFYAAAGASDLAAKKLREVPDRVNKLQSDFKEMQVKVDAKDFPGAAVAYVTHVGTRAVEIFDELAERGKQVVNRVATEAQTQIEEARPTPPASRRAPARKPSATAAAKR
jgi:Tfp pilus assembly protein FimV